MPHRLRAADTVTRLPSESQRCFPTQSGYLSFTHPVELDWGLPLINTAHTKNQGLKLPFHFDGTVFIIARPLRRRRKWLCDLFLLLNLSLLRACNFLSVCCSPSDGSLSLVTLCPGLGLRPFWPHLWILAMSLFFTTNCYLSLAYYCFLYPDTWIQVLLFFHTPVFMVLLNVLLRLFL